MNHSIGPETIAELFDAHGRALVLYARQLCSSPDDAVQEAFLKLSEQRPPPRNPLQWLFRVVRNEALMRIRSEGRRRKREADAAKASNGWFEQRAGDSMDAQAVVSALRELPEEEREVVTARLWGGMTFKEIAELQDTSDSSAHRLYHHALDRLRKRLDLPDLDLPDKEKQ